MQDVSVGLDALSQALASVKSVGKPKMLIVDDEPDNLDLLYRTFRRDFQVFRAESGLAALKVLEEEGEVAVIISDQRMPEMKGTEFLSRTVPQYPYTMRIILTGFTDAEDLVEAINAGQVYKYVTKPWDFDEMQQVVKQAAEVYRLAKQQTTDLERAQAQTTLIKSLIDIPRQSHQFQTVLDTAAATMRSGFDADGCLLVLVEHRQVTSTMGTAGSADHLSALLAKDGLMAQAIAKGDIQGILRSPISATRPETALQSYLIVPIGLQDRLCALLLLGWARPCPLNSDELPMLYFAAQQLALTLESASRVAG